MSPHDHRRLNRRDLLKWGSAAFVGSSPLLRAARLIGQEVSPYCPPGLTEPVCRTGVDALEAFPTSPFVLHPFTDPLPIPRALSLVPKAELDTWTYRPGPGIGQQASDGSAFSRHSIWPDSDPRIYQIRLDVDEHSFTSGKVLPIDASGNEVVAPGGRQGPQTLPASTIFGFNGTRRPLTEGGRATFPGPMIRAASLFGGRP